MAGGAREGAGRPAIPQKDKKKTYSTKLRPDHIEWLRSHKQPAAQILERLIQEEINTKRERI